jgi:transcriptional regulator with XRE-family HTH domain
VIGRRRWVFFVSHTGTTLCDVPSDVEATGSPSIDAEDAPPPAKPLADRLIRIRANLGLNHSQLAELLDVTRKTLYGWLDGDQSPHAANRARLERLERLAEYWAEQSDEPPGDRLKTEIDGGQSLWAYLADNTQGKAAARCAIRKLARQMRAAPKVLSLAERLRQLGFQEPSGLTALDDSIR